MPGRTTSRGYGPAHQRERASWIPYVDAGMVTCARCGHTIQPGTPWDLGHHDTDRSRYQGPEHAHCNRSAGGRARAARQPKRRRDVERHPGLVN